MIKFFSVQLSYITILTLVIYISLNTLIYSLSTSFPNTPFVMTVVILLMVIWLIGIGMRHYIKKSHYGDQLKISFVWSTIISWGIILILFTLM